MRQAVKSATEFLQGMYPNAADVLLEEVEYDWDNKVWRVVSSFNPNAFAVMVGDGRTGRVFKVVEVASDGEPVALKIAQ